MGYTNIGNRGESVLKESIFYKHGRNKLMITKETRYALKEAREKSIGLDRFDLGLKQGTVSLEYIKASNLTISLFVTCVNIFFNII